MKSFELETYEQPRTQIVTEIMEETALLTQSSWDNGSLPDDITDVYSGEL